MGSAVLWRRRRDPAVSATLAAAVAVTAGWAYVLLGRTPDWHPWLRTVVPVGGLLAAGMPGGGFRQGGGGGGLLNAATPSAELTALLRKNSGSYTWVAATVGSNNAAGYQLATRAPVMAVGGFNGTDPAPSLERFKRYVADGEIHYIIGGGVPQGRGDGGGSDVAQEISAWVRANFTATTVSGATLYDLTRPHDR